MKLIDITDHNSDAAFRLVTEYTIVARAIASDLAHIENQTREPGDPEVRWQDMVVADPSGTMRPAGAIVKEGRDYMRRRIAAILQAAR